MADGDGDIPRDAKIIKALLKSMGVEDYEPRVVQQFLELWYRYVVDVLTDSQVYSEHAGKAAIDSDDIKLAIQSKVNFSFSQPPPREDLLELARNRNKIPLPKRVPGPGIPLPNEQDTLINPNYQLAIARKLAEQAVEETEEDEDEEMADPEPEPNLNPNPNPNPEPNPNSTKEHHDTEMPQSRTTPLRVSFPLADKRSR